MTVRNVLTVNSYLDDGGYIRPSTSCIEFLILESDPTAPQYRLRPQKCDPFAIVGVFGFTIYLLSFFVGWSDVSFYTVTYCITSYHTYLQNILPWKQQTTTVMIRCDPLAALVGFYTIETKEVQLSLPHCGMLELLIYGMGRVGWLLDLTWCE